jgi:hypothetical protein
MRQESPNLMDRGQVGARVAAISMAVVLAIIMGGAVGNALSELLQAGGGGCGVPLDAAIEESAEYTPYENRRSRIVESPIVGAQPMGGSLPGAPASIDGMPLEISARPSGLTGYMYYLDRPVTAAMTPSEFLAAGGIQLEIEPAADESFVDYLTSTLGDRAVAIEVGNQEGALVWADPAANGIRSHNVYWSDGTRNYALIADRSAETIVALAREIACN